MFSLSRQTIGVSFAVCLSILGVGLIQFSQLQKLLKEKQTQSLEALEREIKTESTRLQLVKQTPSFGYDNLIADWEYLNFLQYFGDEEVRAKTGYALSPEYFEVILERDPRFLAAYQTLSSSTSIYAGMPERTIEIMEKGLKHLSPQLPARSYYIWRYKGTDELLFLGNTQAAQKSFATAAAWAGQLSDEESKMSALLSQRTAEFLQKNPDSKYARISTWALVLNNQPDERTRQRAIREIEALGGKIVTTPEGNNKILFPEKD